MNSDDAIPVSTCPACGYPLEAATFIGKTEKQPHPGDFSVCVGCGEILCFTENLGQRLADLNDLTQLDKAESDLLTKTQNAVRRYHKSKQPSSSWTQGYQPPKIDFPLKTLDGLFAWAEQYANWFMRESGDMRPAFFFIAADGTPGLLIYGGKSGFEESAKQEFLSFAKTVFIAAGAVAALFASEIWLAKEDKEDDEAVSRPSEALNRIEGVMLLGENRALARQKFLPTIRDGNGNFFNFGESELPDCDTTQGAKFSGRFAGLLTNLIPPPQIQELAKMMLKAKGFDLDSLLIRANTPAPPQRKS